MIISGASSVVGVLLQTFMFTQLRYYIGATASRKVERHSKRCRYKPLMKIQNFCFENKCEIIRAIIVFMYKLGALG